MHNLRVLLLCARAVRGLLVGSCRMHVCAHYTPLAKPDIPMEGLTKKSMGTKCAESCSPPFTELLWEGLVWCTLYPCGTR